MSRIYLMLELSIQKFHAGNWVAIVQGTDTDLAPIQAIGQTFIQQLKVQVGNVDVYDGGTLYPYRCYLTTELSYPDA